MDHSGLDTWLARHAEIEVDGWHVVGLIDSRDGVPPDDDHEGTRWRLVRCLFPRFRKTKK
jgi:hypothetical protein